MTEDMLDDLYDCLVFLNKVRALNEFNKDELETLDKAYNIVERLYDRYTA